MTAIPDVCITSSQRSGLRIRIAEERAETLYHLEEYVEDKEWWSCLSHSYHPANLAIGWNDPAMIAAIAEMLTEVLM